VDDRILRVIFPKKNNNLTKDKKNKDHIVKIIYEKLGLNSETENK
jgi:hypothetical protein